MYNDEQNLYHYTYRKDGTEPGQRYDAKQPTVDEQLNSYRQQQEQQTQNSQPVYQSQPQGGQTPHKNGKNRLGLKIASLALVCALLGGLVGGGTAYLVSNSSNSDTTEVNVSNRKPTEIQLKTVDGKNPMTDAELYAANVNSVVSINITATSDPNFFGQTTQTAGAGSGFILTPDGYIVTNYHVVEDATSVTVTTQSDESYEATVIGHDTTADMALLKVEAQNLQAVTLGSSSELMIGDMVVAIGNPLGTLNATQTVGYISGINRQVSTDNNYTTMLQTDAAINSGNSGGPLFNTKGEVIGITTAKYSGTSSSGASIEGIGFAIPIDDLKRNLEELQTKGYISSAYLGIMGMDVDPEAVKNYGIPSGAYVDSVEANSPAEQAGVQAKDIIIALGGQKISSFSDLARVLRSFSPEDETTVTVYRGGKELTLPITLGEKPREDASAQAENGSEMPSEGSFQEWFDYFNRFSGVDP